MLYRPFQDAEQIWGSVSKTYSGGPDQGRQATVYVTSRVEPAGGTAPVEKTTLLAAMS